MAKADWIVRVAGRCEEVDVDGAISWICKEPEGHEEPHKDVWFGHVHTWSADGSDASTTPPGSQ